MRVTRVFDTLTFDSLGIERPLLLVEFDCGHKRAVLRMDEITRMVMFGTVVSCAACIVRDV